MAFPAKAPSQSPVAVTNPVRVMVVDDSVVIRSLITKWIDEDAGLAVVATHRNGKAAVDDVERSEPDVVILDIEMPEMDGLSALPLMLKKRPGLTVIMASTLTRRNAEISLKALSLGAADYVPKPESARGGNASETFRHDLTAKVKTLGARAQRRRGIGAAPARTVMRSGSPARPAAPVEAAKSDAKLRPYSKTAPRALVIGSSTGGPQALAEVFKDVGPAMNGVPVLVAQHMPPTFTSILAEHIGRTASRPSAEAVDGEPLKPGRIYIAKGGLHMVLEKGPGGPVIRLSDAPPVNFCKPAVDPLFESAAAIFGPALLAAVLTGMGHDGAEGAKVIASSGGSVIAQDEATSVVWGMPGAAVRTGQCADVLPLNRIGSRLAHLIGGGRP